VSDEPDVSLPRWRDPAWRAAADAWDEEQLAAAGRRVTGPGDSERLVPWSAVWRVPTDGGPVWFKACSTGVRHEPALYEVLVRRAPDHVVIPLATDVDRGFLLLPDGGPTLRQMEGARADLAAWAGMLQEYAVMQRGLEHWADELRATGLAVAGPDGLPGMREALLADDRLLLLGDPEGLTAEQRAELVAAQPAYAAQCAELAAYGIPLSLQHDDLHDNNVFGPAEPGGPLRVFDWGDGVLGHPFGVLLISLRVVSDLLDVGESSPEVRRLRDAYLEPWVGEWDLPDLRDAARLAVRVGGVSRADCYRRATMDWPVDTPTRAPFVEGVPAWLLEQRGPMPLEEADATNAGEI
jgi:hypothetical protein